MFKINIRKYSSDSSVILGCHLKRGISDSHRLGVLKIRICSIMWKIMPGFLAFKVIFKEKKRINEKNSFQKKNGYLIHA